jgi:hypothetical protein
LFGCKYCNQERKKRGHAAGVTSRLAILYSSAQHLYKYGTTLSTQGVAFGDEILSFTMNKECRADVQGKKTSLQGGEARGMEVEKGGEKGHRWKG